MSSEVPFGCSDPPPAELFAEIWRRHGHRCPMSTLGGRLGHAVHRRLGGADLRVRYRIATCAVDGIAVATGCTPIEGTLVVVEEGLHQLSGRSPRGAVTVTIRPDILELAGEFRRFDNALDAERADLSPEALRQRLDEREQRLDRLLVRLCHLPEEQLLLIGDPPAV